MDRFVHVPTQPYHHVRPLHNCVRTSITNLYHFKQRQETIDIISYQLNYYTKEIYALRENRTQKYVMKKRDKK